MRNKMPPRISGILLLLLGTLTGWFSIYLPLQGAAHHESGVSLTTKGIVLTPIFLFSGLGYVIFGDSLTPILTRPPNERGRRNLTLIGWLLLAAGMGIGFAVEQWLKHSLKMQGYGV